MSHKYENANFASFLDVLKHFLENDAKSDKTPLAACFAAAGPVKDNKMRFTNRAAWSIDGYEIEEAMGIKKVLIINDFLAVGYGILTLDIDKECITLQHAPRIPTAPIACIGAGTGLGECFLTPGTDGVYTCFPCEGGHAEFAPRNEVKMANFLNNSIN